MKIKSNRFVGVYTYKSKVSDDECYYIVYKDGNRKVTEKIGWKSEDFTQAQASVIRSEKVFMSKNKKKDLNDAHRVMFSRAFFYYINAQVSMTNERKELLKSRYNKMLHVPLGGIRMGHIKPSKIRAVLEYMDMKSMNRSTIKQYFQLISRVFDFMMKEFDLEENPCDKIVYKAKDRARYRYLTKMEANLLLIATKKADNDLYLQTVIGLFTGMRLSEIMNLRYDHINFESNLIYVSGKGRDGAKKERTVEMIDVVEEGIIRHSEWQFGKVFDKKFKRKKFQRIVKELGLNDDCTSRLWKVTPHTLRHTFGSWLGQDGVAPQIIQQVMGHDNVTTAMRYVKLGPRIGSQAVANLTKGVDI